MKEIWKGARAMLIKIQAYDYEEYEGETYPATASIFIVRLEDITGAESLKDDMFRLIFNCKTNRGWSAITIDSETMDRIIKLTERQS